MGAMTLDDHRRFEEKLGAYALGQLDDNERTELETHLNGCPICQNELEQIVPIAALLPKVDPDKLEEPLAFPPAHLAERVYERVGQERRRESRRRPAGMGLGIAAAFLVVFLALSTFFLLEEPGERVTLQPVAARTALPAGFQNLEATATLRAEDYSTQIELDVTGLTPGQTYTVWLERADGTRVPAGGFQAFDQGPITVYLSGALPPEEAVGLGLGTSDGETVLRKDLEGDDDRDLIVPNLLGRTLEDARETAGPDFEVDAQEEGDGGQSGGTIVGQDPASGDRARKGSTISVELSSGHQTSRVTNGTGTDSPNGPPDESDSEFGNGDVAEQALEVASGAAPAPNVGLAQNAGTTAGTGFTANQPPVVIPGIGPTQELSSPGRTVTTPQAAPLPGSASSPGATPLPGGTPLSGSAPLPGTMPAPGGTPLPGGAPLSGEVPGTAPAPGAAPDKVPPNPEGALPPEGNTTPNDASNNPSNPKGKPDNPGNPKGEPDNPGRPKGNPDNPGRPKGNPDHPDRPNGENPGRPTGNPDTPGRPKGNPDNPGRPKSSPGP
jgi:hypothetical protein